MNILEHLIGVNLSWVGDICVIQQILDTDTQLHGQQVVCPEKRVALVSSALKH